MLYPLGLSPRVWGSPQVLICLWRYSRSIPTCVGQPAKAAGGWAADRVYPHVCGAAAMCCAMFLGVRGLSPRVWGSPAEAAAAGPSRRSIPTCVGQPLPPP